MKKLFFILSLLMLTACSDNMNVEKATKIASESINKINTSTENSLDKIGNFGGELITQAIKKECKNQIKQHIKDEQIKAVVNATLTNEQKQNLQQDVCECVVKEAKNKQNYKEIESIFKDGTPSAENMVGFMSKMTAKCVVDELKSDKK